LGWRLRFGVARGDNIAQFLEVAVVEFGIVRRRIVLRWISRITVFGEEIAVGNFGFDGSVVGNEGAVDVAGAFEGFIGFAFGEFGVVFGTEFFGGLVAVFLEDVNLAGEPAEDADGASEFFGFGSELFGRYTVIEEARFRFRSILIDRR